MLPAVKEDFAVVKKTASRFLQIEKVCLRDYHDLPAVTAVNNSLFDLVLFQFSHGPKSQKHVKYFIEENKTAEPNKPRDYKPLPSPWQL